MDQTWSNQKVFKHYKNVSIVYHLKPNKKILVKCFARKMCLPCLSLKYLTLGLDIYIYIYIYIYVYVCVYIYIYIYIYIYMYISVSYYFLIISVENSCAAYYFLETDDLFDDSLYKCNASMLNKSIHFKVLKKKYWPDPNFLTVVYLYIFLCIFCMIVHTFQ